MEGPNGDIDFIDLHARASLAFAQVLADLPADRLGDQTPCAGWDIRALVNHLTELHRGAAAAFGGADPSNLEPVPASDDPRPAFVAAARDARAAFSTPGAMARTYAMPWGDSPGTMIVRMLAADSVIHTWDLAKAAGQPYPLDPAACQAVLDFGTGMMRPEYRTAESGFGAEVAVAEDAPVWDRMAAFFGRQP